MRSRCLLTAARRAYSARRGGEKKRIMKNHFVELIRRAACCLPQDVILALEQARDREDPHSNAASALRDILANCGLAEASSRPLCQDTGTHIWYVHYPRSLSQAAIEADIIEATREATRLSYLRPNAVHPLTGRNTGDNVGHGAPVIHMHEWDQDHLMADLLLKGGGSENVSTTYSLPHGPTKADRDVEGVRRVVIDAVFEAQGRGCGPGIIGIGIGGDRATSMVEAKEQLFRSLADRNPDPLLDQLERRLLEDCNSLGVGPMGFGGKTTVLGVKAGVRHRLPASFFVSIAYICWAARRGSVSIFSDQTATYGEQTHRSRAYLSGGQP